MIHLDLIPNTGHHFVWVPVAAARTGREALTTRQISELEGLPAFDADDYAKLSRQVDRRDWRSPTAQPWFRWRLSEKKLPGADGLLHQVICLVVAFDTSMGDKERGTTFDPLSQSSPSVKISDRAAGHYFETDVAALTDGDRPQFTWDSKAELKTEKSLKVEASVSWIAGFGEPVDVDLVVDFGNTRTVVLALEDVAEVGADLSAFCRVVQIEGRELPTNRADAWNSQEDCIVPSWVVLQEPAFNGQFDRAYTIEVAKYRPKRGFFASKSELELEGVTRRLPHTFKELSPVAMGAEAHRILGGQRPGGLFYMSSPKRYIWDRNRVGTGGLSYWTMVPNSWAVDPEAGPTRAGKLLSGEVNMYSVLGNEGAEWEADEPPTEWPAGDLRRPVRNVARPDYPRSEAMRWAALSILEHAYTHLNSSVWRSKALTERPRRIRDVYVTYPAGWSREELDSYQRLWSGAAKTFYASRFPIGTAAANLPKVRFDLDEAIAPQLAILYSEIRHLGDKGENFIKLYGASSGNGASLRLMTIDIGGGTTDTSIVQHTDTHPGRGVALESTLIYKDSSSYAGDELVKALIEGLLLPAIGENACATPAHKAAFEDLLYESRGQDKTNEWSFVCRSLFVPLVTGWLQQLSDVLRNDPAASLSSFRAASCEELGIPLEVVDHINALLSSAQLPNTGISYSTRFAIDLAAIDAVIRAWYEPIVDAQSKIAAVLGADLVLLSGKTSEIPTIAEMTRKFMPITPDRIVESRDYFAGSWLPSSRVGSIQDAKMTTVLGGAIYAAIRNNRVANWSIQELKKREQQRFYWGPVSQGGSRFTEGDIYVKRGERSAPVALIPNTFVGRSLHPKYGRVEQMYRFVWTGKRDEQPRRIDVRLERSSDSGSENPVASGSVVEESLLLVAATATRDGTKDDVMDRVSWELCTLPLGEVHWLDSARFEVRWRS